MREVKEEIKDPEGREDDWWLEVLGNGSEGHRTQVESLVLGDMGET